MKTNYLLPHCCKRIGLIAAIPFLTVGLCYLIDVGIGLEDSPFNFLTEKMWEFEFLDEIVVIGLVVTLLVAAFSREKDEDEYTTSIRARSLVVSVVLSYAIVVVGTLCFYEFAYLSFLCGNLFTVLIAYILIFNIAMARARKEATSEK